MVDDSAERKIELQGIEKNAPRKGSSIDTRRDNSIVTGAEQNKQDNFTSDVLKSISANDTSMRNRSLQIVDGDNVVVDSHNKQNRQRRLIASDGDKTQKQFELKADENLFLQYIDSDGVVPFGGSMKGSISDSRIKSTKYANLTLGIRGYVNGGEADRDVLSVNIGDNFKLNGHLVLDGKEHRGVFPIAPSAGMSRHYKWIDATIQKRDEKTADLTIHRLSPLKERPRTDAEWDPVRFETCRFPLKMVEKAKHPKHPGEFWNYESGGPLQEPDYWTHNNVRRLEINEKVKN